ncbi:hypothetical protein TRFO_34535 [Tritrichomonas foetus]|uniref:Uncharacterized protein n=1 Tax=Tritrichomonas foetus TaxID=1144522 RepID=A0A1J4JIW9_9EUKA|nr:hypothetical protein TRFO_34535 [Tritrichomonas foetus]|eukprot:OHS99128.1 hypothetical protein TRFO_34535 [Tritrichomonas foetus]
MWKVLNKVGELLTSQQPNELEEFKKSCQTAIEIIQSRAVDETSKLKAALSLIISSLLQESNEVDFVCFDYFVEQSILAKIANHVTSDLPSEHLEPVLDFFLRFINTELSAQLAQVSVHTPITNILSKLESLDHKCPKETREFASNIWETCKRRPILLEMMAVTKSKERTFPLLDFFCAASFTLTEIGLKSREIILFLFNKPENSEPMPEHFGKYVCSKLFPQFVEFLQAVSSYVSTIQFGGSMTSTIQWIDQLLMVTNVSFPIEQIYQVFSELPPFKRNLATSFYLSFFSSHEIVKYSIDYAISHLDDIIVCLSSDNNQDNNSALTLIKIMLTFPATFPYLIPPVSEHPADILSLVPLQWLLQCEGSSGTEAYVTDSIQRIDVLGIRRKPENESNQNSSHDNIKNDQVKVSDNNGASGNSDIFIKLLTVFKRFDTLSIHIALLLTQVLAYYFAIAPDLINTDLADAFKAAVNKYSDVEAFSLTFNENTNDSPELRAAILSEFAKEIHGTFIASEKITTITTGI